VHFKSKAPPIPNTCTSKGNLEDEISYYGKSQYLCGNTVLQSILGLTVAILFARFDKNEKV